MGWVKRKETTREIEAFVQLLAEEKFTFQKIISTIVYDHAIPGDLIINLDYTPLSYVSPRKYLFKVNGAKNLHDKRQITTNFAVRATWEFYPIKLKYTEKPRDVCLQNVSFPRSFHVRYTENYWSNQLKAAEHFEKVILPYLDQTKENMGYSKMQMSLVIMDTFKEQVNNETRELCTRNNCEIVIAPHNLTNRFQPLDFSGCRSAKTYVSEM